MRVNHKTGYLNRKGRNDQKLNHRYWVAFWDRTNDAYKGKEREIMLTLCKSSSLETTRIAERKMNEIIEDERKRALKK